MRRWIVALGGAVLVLPLIFASAPSLLDAARLGISLRGKSWEQRREYIFGPYYRELADIGRSIPANDLVAVVPQRDADRDIAMFSVYQLYPRRARVVKSIDAQTKWVVVIDQSRTPAVTLIRGGVR